MYRFGKITGYISIILCCVVMAISTLELQIEQDTTWRNHVITFHSGVMLAIICFIDWMGVLKQIKFFTWLSMLMWTAGTFLIFSSMIFGEHKPSFSFCQLSVAAYTTVMVTGRAALLISMYRSHRNEEGKDKT